MLESSIGNDPARHVHRHQRHEPHVTHDGRGRRLDAGRLADRRGHDPVESGADAVVHVGRSRRLRRDGLHAHHGRRGGHGVRGRPDRLRVRLPLPERHQLLARPRRRRAGREPDGGHLRAGQRVLHAPRPADPDGRLQHDRHDGAGGRRHVGRADARRRVERVRLLRFDVVGRHPDQGRAVAARHQRNRPARRR